MTERALLLPKRAAERKAQTVDAPEIPTASAARFQRRCNVLSSRMRDEVIIAR